jgi:hypothetical protein
MKTKFDQLVDKLLNEGAFDDNLNDLMNRMHPPAEPKLFGHHSSTEDYKVGPVYHGGGWNGVSMPSIRDGSYGTGVYFTTSKQRAMGYATEEREFKASKTRYLVEAMLGFYGKVLEINTKAKEGPQTALMRLTGWDERKAWNSIDKQFEKTGNLGKMLRVKGTAAGFDGLAIHNDTDTEYVVWFPQSIKVIKVEPVDF